jgi:hypothetical protein
MEAIIIIGWIALIIALAGAGRRRRQRWQAGPARPRTPVARRERLMWTTFLLRANELAAERSREARREVRARELRRQLVKGRRPTRRPDPDEPTR